MVRKILCSGLLLLLFSNAQAGVFELGGSFSYSRSRYNAGSFTLTKSYSASLGYYFTEDSELEFSYQDVNTHAYVENAQDIKYRDRIYSLNLLYYLSGQDSSFRPYFRIGAGQLNRDATGTYAGGYSPPGRLDQISVIGGLGFKMRLGAQFGLKMEATSYLTGGDISTWDDNITFNIGGSFYF